MTAGFNLIGYATSPTGLGEDLRAFAAMLDHLEIPYSVTDVPTEIMGQVKAPWKKLTSIDYASSFFFMSPMECMRLFKAQPDLFEKPRLKVGYFLWELPDFPSDFIPALALMDHIWCPTNFVQSALFKETSKLILAIPLPVLKEPWAGKNFRAALGIPENAFVALYLYDVRSTNQRKNPQGTVNAFLAFAERHRDCYLILKVNRWQHVDRRLLSWIPAHPRIKLVTETLDHAGLSDLYRAANVYLSLHRSEGFGRTLVEAMQHGLRLVCTDYSGPADYLTTENAYIVDWMPKPVLKGEYPYTEGSTWSEPSLLSAVARLEEAYAAGNTPMRQGIELAGQQFTVAGLAERYRRILKTYLLSN